MCVCLVRSYEPETSLRLSDSNVFIIVLAEEYKEFLVKQEIYVYMFFKYVTALFFIFFFFFFSLKYIEPQDRKVRAEKDTDQLHFMLCATVILSSEDNKWQKWMKICAFW